MQASGSWAAEQRAKIRNLCAYIKSDTEIANYMRCDIALVRDCRANLPKARGRPRHGVEPLVNQSGMSDYAITAADAALKRAKADGCSRLLRRQLETGQHSLNADQFFAVCIGMGWLPVGEGA